MKILWKTGVTWTLLEFVKEKEGEVVIATKSYTQNLFSILLCSGSGLIALDNLIKTLQQQKQSSQVCLLKKMHNLKVEHCVLFGGLSEDFKPRDSLSDSSTGPLQRIKGGARIHDSFVTKSR